MLYASSLMAQQSTFKNGFWMIESNVKTPKRHIVRFYNEAKVLMYEEEVLNKRLNLNREKVKKALNKVLVSLINNEKIAFELQNQRVMLSLK